MSVQQVQTQLQQIVQAMLGTTVSMEQPLMEAGLDSLGAVELRNTISNQFSIELPATVMFDYPSISALAGYIINQVQVTHSAPTLDPTSAAMMPISQALKPVGLQQHTHSAAFVVGANSCYPTAAGLDGFWGVLTGSRDVQSVVPYSRWDMDAHYAPDTKPGRMTASTRHVLFSSENRISSKNLWLSYFQKLVLSLINNLIGCLLCLHSHLP